MDNIFLQVARATNIHVAERRRCFYFLQHDNLLRAEVVIRATKNRNRATSYKNMLPVLLGLYWITQSIREIMRFG